MLIKSKLIAQAIPERLRENEVYCRAWGNNGLAVHFYDGEGRPYVSWWSDGQNSVKYLRRQAEWTSCGLPFVMGRVYGITRKETDRESGEAAEGWRAANHMGSGGSLLSLCMTFDSNRNYERRIKAKAGRAERMEREFAAFPQRRDKEVEDWLDTALPQYLMYGKQSRRHEREVRCTACGGTWTADGRAVRRGETGSCPLCGGAGVYHPTFGRLPRAESNDVWTAERDGNTVWWRVTTYVRHMDENGYKRWCAEDTLRIRETQKNGAAAPERRAYVCGQWGWKRCKRDEVWERDALVYPAATEVYGAVIGNTPTAMLGRVPHPISLYHTADALRRVEGAEYYAKLGLWRLLMASYREGRSIPVPPPLRYLARRFDVYAGELAELEEYGAVPPDRFAAIRALNGGVFRRSETERAMGLDTYIHHFSRWKAQKPGTDIRQLERWYNDYIGMCRACQCDLSRKEVRFPRDLKAEHDRLAERYTLHKAEYQNREFAEVCRKLYAPMHGYTDSRYTVVFPQLRTDLIAEGQSLHHCVGMERYYKSHLKGVRMIFFIRRADEPDKPLYTMEADVRKLMIVQLYGAYDKPAPKEVRTFCERFLRQLWTGTEEKQAKCS